MKIPWPGWAIKAAALFNRTAVTITPAKAVEYLATGLATAKALGVDAVGWVVMGAEWAKKKGAEITVRPVIGWVAGKLGAGVGLVTGFASAHPLVTAGIVALGLAAALTGVGYVSWTATDATRAPLVQQDSAPQQEEPSLFRGDQLRKWLGLQPFKTIKPPPPKTPSNSNDGEVIVVEQGPTDAGTEGSGGGAGGDSTGAPPPTDRSGGCPPGFIPISNRAYVDPGGMMGPPDHSTATPTADPTTAPTADPTAAPTADPTAAPTADPADTPSASPSASQTDQPIPSGCIEDPDG